MGRFVHDNTHDSHYEMRNAVGLLGGSFNPAHGGHRSISLFAIDALQLDALWWIVSPGNPLKSDKGMAKLSHRMASAKTQSRRSKIKVSAIEMQLGTLYTLDMVRRLKRRYPKHDFIWLMGADNLAQFHRWHKWKEIAHTLPIAVVERPGYNDRARFSPAMAYFRKFQKPKKFFQGGNSGNNPTAPLLIFLRFRPDNRSATMVRMANPRWFDCYRNLSIKDDITHRLYD